MRMAAHYGCTIRELNERLGTDELEEWLALDRLYNFPDIYYLAAVLGCAVTGPWMKPGKHPDPASFAPIFDARRKQSAKDVIALFESMQSTPR